ncbi:Lipid-A-disaccharide synthase [Desulfosarcina cetonica]|nr:Lipid-A-disaccharide synthase [Desulfosarcina cetonica]
MPVDIPMKMSSKRIMIIAGEASGDMHGAKLAESLKRYDRQVFLCGIGGSAMRAEGVELLLDANTLSVVGITEVLTKLPAIRQAMQRVKNALSRLRPHLLILIDYPDFNFRVAAIAKRQNIPVLYYISPQIWAWRQNRVKTIKRLVDHMAVILPFELPFYLKHRVPVTFVGHPLLDRIQPQAADMTRLSTPSPTTIGLLPGSREKEVTTLLPVMIAAAKKIRQDCPTTRFLVSCADSIDAKLIDDTVNRIAEPLDIKVVKGPASTLFKQSQLLVAASGTVTLEAALHGIPLVIIYKVSPLSYWLGRRLIKVKHIGIVNLIAQKSLLPELIQADASPAEIAATVSGMLNNPKRLNQIRAELLRVRNVLGGPGASDRVARIAFNLIKKRKHPGCASIRDV